MLCPTSSYRPTAVRSAYLTTLRYSACFFACTLPVIIFLFYYTLFFLFFFFFSSRRRHTRCLSDWSSDVCSSDLKGILIAGKTRFALNLFRSHICDSARYLLGTLRTRTASDRSNAKVTHQNLDRKSVV